MRIQTFILSAILLVFSSSFALAQRKSEAVLQATTAQKKVYANAFINLYTNLCIKNINDMDAVRALLQKETPLPPEAANFFLNGIAGKVWPARGVEGKHLLALADKVYYCAIYTLAADVPEIEKRFDQISQTAPEGVEFTLLKDEKTQTEHNGVTHTKTYAMTHSERELVIVLTLTTHSNPQRGAPQGIASIQLDKI